MKAKVGPEIVNSYKRLSYKEWYALAEFIDNSTQAYFNQKAQMDSQLKKEKELLTIQISIEKDANNNNYLQIKDNSIGMNEEELSYAVQFGMPPKNTNGRSKYGLGMKTAASWLGNYWTVKTKKLGESTEHSVEFDVNKISNNDLELNHTKKEINNLQEHYTIICIYKLNRDFQARTKGKIIKYLSSMYRHDFKKINLQLYVLKKKLAWNEEEVIDNKLIVNKEGDPLKREFTFTILGKTVIGWAGVFKDGARSKAGFSLIQADRVIVDWNPGFRPIEFFGDNSNDLVNQRLVGELFLDGFDVSHTKDDILFSDSELDQIDYFLNKEIGDLRETALSFRKKDSLDNNIEIKKEEAIKKLSNELRSDILYSKVSSLTPTPIEVIKSSKEVFLEKIEKEFEPKFRIMVNDLLVILYVVDDVSVYEPYLTIQSCQDKNSVIIVVNAQHPYWNELSTEESILDYLRQCVYDGIAEWKATFVAKSLEPDTIKNIKDNYLRVPFEIKMKK